MTLVDVHTIVVRAQLEAGVAMALVLASHVDAGAVFADVRVSGALVHVHAGVPGGGEVVPGVTDTLEAALEVLAFAVLTDMRPLDTLVDVYTIDESRTMFVSLRTFTFEAPWKVDALSVPTARRLRTLIVVNTLMRIGVIDIPSVALTFEAGRSVDTLSMFAHRRHQLTFVNAFGLVGHRVHNLTWVRSTQTNVFTSV